MIDSCSKCTTKCCKSGPGPYKPVKMEDFLSHKYKGSQRYNTMCEHFDLSKEICKIWDKAPLVCKTFVCGVRTYTRSELRAIDKLWKKYNKKSDNELYKREE